MAQRVTVQLVDDTDGTEAAESVTFGLDGVTYEVDLSEPNADRMRESLAEFVAAARRVKGSRGYRTARRTGGTAPTAVDREQNRAMREWANRNGYNVSDRGRISAAVQSAYHAAHAPDTEPAAPKPRARKSPARTAFAAPAKTGPKTRGRKTKS